MTKFIAQGHELDDQRKTVNAGLVIVSDLVFLAEAAVVDLVAGNTGMRQVNGEIK